MRRAAALAVAAALAFAIVTALALEGEEVVVLHTQRADGGARATRTWIAAADGALWIEAANAERPFYRDLLRQPRVELERDGATLPYHALAQPGRAGHERIRALLRARYGWADWWIGLLTDTSNSIAIRLESAGAG